MNTYIALFRGINVGGKNILPMKDLVRVLECAGCEDVKTYIQSGNAVFQTNRNKANKLAKVDIKSLEFHTSRGDFEAWFKSLGDPELANKVAEIREKKVAGEQLRKMLHDTVEQRCTELMKLTETATP